MAVTIIVGQNSYVSVADFNDYMSGRFGADAIGAVTDVTALIATAARELDLMICGSVKATADQKMLFPILGGGGVIPDNVKAAQCELAIAIAEAGGVPGAAVAGQTVTEIKAGSVGLKFGSADVESGSNRIHTDTVKALLAPYGLCKSGNKSRVIPVVRGA
jgi:hypothetical protein